MPPSILHQSITMPGDPPEFRLGRVENFLGRIGLGSIAMRLAAARWRYEAARWYIEAAKIDRTTGDWKKINVSANTVVGSDAALARSRARALAYSSYGSRVKNVIIDNVIGVGIRTQSRIAYSKDVETNETLNTQAEDRKRRWMEEASVDGRTHYYEMQRLSLQSVIVDGAVLIRRRFLNDSSRILPLAYELIEIDALTDLGAKPQKGNQLIQGIEIDADGRPVAYHIDSGGYRRNVQRIPTDQIYHLYRLDRPGQVQGVTWYAPIIPDLNMLHGIKEYSLIAHKVQTAVALVISHDSGMPAGIPGIPTSAVEESTSSVGSIRKRIIESGLIHDVGQGKVTAFTPPARTDLDIISTLLLRSIGIGIGLSYETVAGDYTKLSFAGGRLSLQDMWRGILPVHAWLTRRMETPIHRDWVDAELTFGAMRRPPKKSDPYAVRFSRPHRDWGVNPYQEVRAAAAAIAAKISTIRDEVEARGGDWQDVLKQAAVEVDFAKALGLQPEDPAQTGAPQK